MPDLPASELATVVERYLAWLAVRSYAEGTIRQRGVELRIFVRWCAERDLDKLSQVNRKVLLAYQRWLFAYRKATGKPLDARTQASRLIAVRVLFRWLVKSGHLGCNPAADVDLPRLPRRKLPRGVLTREELESLLTQPDLETTLGVRDRAILEVLYSTGLRVSELVVLKLEEVRWEEATVTVLAGKGRKDRIVPIGSRALTWLGKYVTEARSRLVTGRDERRVFVKKGGQGLSPDYVGQLVRRYLEAAGVERPGRCHMLRHTMATQMLEGGADVRYIQEILGHEDLSSTQIYTHVSIRHLKDVYQATHPGARLERKAHADEGA